MTEPLAELLADLAVRGVELRVGNGRLRFRPRGAVDDALRARLLDLKAELLALVYRPVEAAGGGAYGAASAPTPRMFLPDASLTAPWTERHEERAAIHEYEAELPRAEAEARAFAAMLAELREAVEECAPTVGERV